MQTKEVYNVFDNDCDLTTQWKSVLDAAGSIPCSRLYTSHTLRFAKQPFSGESSHYTLTSCLFIFFTKPSHFGNIWNKFNNHMLYEPRVFFSPSALIKTTNIWCPSVDITQRTVSHSLWGCVRGNDRISWKFNEPCGGGMKKARGGI